MMTNVKTKLVGYGLASAALTGLVAPVALIGTAGSASAAASCGTTVSDRDNRSWPRQTSGVSANQRSGSSSGCGNTGYADNRNVLDYHCYTVSSSGSTWTYLRNDTDGTAGWVAGSLLPLNSGGSRGSLVYCGF